MTADQCHHLLHAESGYWSGFGEGLLRPVEVAPAWPSLVFGAAKVRSSANKASVLRGQHGVNAAGDRVCRYSCSCAKQCETKLWPAPRAMITTPVALCCGNQSKSDSAPGLKLFVDLLKQENGIICITFVRDAKLSPSCVAAAIHERLGATFAQKFFLKFFICRKMHIAI